jgi:hypothetical protein
MELYGPRRLIAMLCPVLAAWGEYVAYLDVGANRPG